MNNCVVRTILSAVLGSGMGVMFGVFMGTMDTVGAPGVVSPWRHPWQPAAAGAVGLSPAHAAPAAARIDCLHCVLLLQGVGIDGSMVQQKQTVKQAMKDMAKNTFSKSK